MPFDVDKFINTRWEPREFEISVPVLKDFFGPDEKPIWKVRGLPGLELGRANEAAARNQDIAAILEKLLSATSKVKADGVMESLGLSDKTPQDLAKRIEMFIAGSVEPKGNLDLAKKLLAAFPIEFYEITNKILELTGMGHIPGEPKPSGKTMK